MTRGDLKYVPKELIEELVRVRKDFGIIQDADAFRKIAENSRIGRQIRFSIDFNINRRKK